MFITKQELGFYFSIPRWGPLWNVAWGLHPQRNPMVFLSERSHDFRCLNPMKYQYPIYDSYDEVIEYVIGWNSMSTSSTAQGVAEVSKIGNL